ncbi:MAG: TetR/AcrR family transcriptional regulator [Proteobacteria bacterium]|nr:TetR/AcrR family transcriptional regulator [Pseudomonadota bacterium]
MSKANASRGQRSDGEATRARILEAAGELWATTSFAETTSKAIAAKAGVDLASINYHFGSRGGLYQAVLIEAHHRLMDLDELTRLAQSPLAATDKLRILIAQIVRQAVDDGGGWHLPVLAAEVLAPSSHAKVLEQAEILPKAPIALGILSEITGLPADDPALPGCLVSAIGPCLLLLIGRRGLPGPVQQVRAMPYPALVDQLHRFAVGGLEAVGRAAAPPR